MVKRTVSNTAWNLVPEVVKDDRVTGFMQRSCLSTQSLAYFTPCNDFSDSGRIPKILYCFFKRERHSQSLKGKILLAEIRGFDLNSQRARIKSGVRRRSFGSPWRTSNNHNSSVEEDLLFYFGFKLFVN